MIEKIVSGGQTGADRAGLIAALKCGIKTGGYIPKGFKTELGSEPQLGKLYGLIELGKEYPQRTLANVQQADATWIFYRGKLERGSKLTVDYCERLHKPYLTINLDDGFEGDLSAWLMFHKVKVLNIAGNRESVAPGIQIQVEKILTEIFRKL